MKKYRFLKSYKDFGIGDIVEIDEKTAEVLLDTETVELYDEEAEKAYNKQMEGIKEMVEGVVAKAVAALTPKDMPNGLNIMVEVTQDEAEKGFESVGDQLKAIAKAAEEGATPDPRLLAINEKAITGMSETVGTEGGFLLQDTFTGELTKRMLGDSILAAQAQNVTIGANSNGLTWNDRRDYDQQNSARNIQVYWTEEGGSLTASKGKINRQTLSLEKLTGLYYATDESLQDAQSLGQLMDDWFMEEFPFKLDQTILRGDGVAKPLGILNASCLVTVAKESGQTADTIVAKNIVKMYSRMWARSMGQAAWYVNQEILPELMVLTLTTSGTERPIWTPPDSGFVNAPGGFLLGRPIRFLDHASTLGDKGDIWFMDMSKYRLISKGGIQRDSSIHVRFLNDETAFRFRMRMNGQPTWSDVVTPSQATTHTRSPFITLAARA